MKRITKRPRPEFFNQNRLVNLIGREKGTYSMPSGDTA